MIAAQYLQGLGKMFEPQQDNYLSSLAKNFTSKTGGYLESLKKVMMEPQSMKFEVGAGLGIEEAKKARDVVTKPVIPVGEEPKLAIGDLGKGITSTDPETRRMAMEQITELGLSIGMTAPIKKMVGKIVPFVKPKFVKTGNKEFDSYVEDIYKEFPKEKPDLLKQAKEKFPELDVFDVDLSGSYKRGTPNVDSDIDVKIFFRNGDIDDIRTKATGDFLYGRGGTYDLHFEKVVPIAKTFGGLKNLSTKLLEKFRGMPEEITPQQFNEVLNKASKEGIREVDRNLITELRDKQLKYFRENTAQYERIPKGEIGYDMGAVRMTNQPKINLTQLAKDAQTSLVPLTPTQVKSPRWSNVGQDFIGDGKYGEIVYESPIKTSAGEVHYPPKYRREQLSPSLRRQNKDLIENYPNYFSHIRYEDMADGKTRKILETQSDLFQKGGLESEYDVLGKETEKMAEKRLQGIDKLQPYSSNDPLAHLRTFREEVKRAAKDGKDTILIPSGETAMKIKETFDISGKVDTQHFVYKLNESAIPKEARKMGLIVEGKVKADNGEWWKIKIPKERGKMPVEAFGAFPLIYSSEEKE